MSCAISNSSSTHKLRWPTPLLTSRKRSSQRSSRSRPVQLCAWQTVYPNIVEERKQVGFIGNSITLKNVRHTADQRVATVTRRTHTSKHKKNYFTVEEMKNIIVKFERLDRPKGCILNDGRIERDEVIFDRLRRWCGESRYCVCWF